MTIMKHTILIVSAVLSLSGCGVYKPYSRPQVETDGLYRDVPTEDTVTIASLSWRELFADPQLQTLVEKGWNGIPTCVSPACASRRRKPC